MNNLYPIFLDIGKKACLVVGGGSVALRKVEALLSAGAVVKVVSPCCGDELDGLAKKNKDLIIEKKCFEDGDIDGTWLVIAATDLKETNQKISSLAKSRGLLVNVVDDPELCNFYVPSVAVRGGLMVAVSTGGRCPALAKKIRQLIEAHLDPALERLLEHLSAARTRLFKKYPNDPKRRGDIMKRIVNSGVVENAAGLTEEDMAKEIDKWL